MDYIQCAGVDVEMVNNLLPGAMVIFLVGFVESIAVGKEFANKYQYRLSANRELVAFGMHRPTCTCSAFVF
jgi:MFS superfamily sulfate permease-like transporter